MTEAAAGTPKVAPSAPGDNRLLRAFPAKELVAVSGDGSFVVASDGKRYLDLGGASHGVAILGHNHPAVTEAVSNQASKLVHVAGGIPSYVRGQFLDALHARLPSHLTRSFLANSGTEAMECALKLSVAATGRSRFVAAQNSFHGRSTGALGVTHRPGFRQPFQGILPACDFVAFNNEEALKAAVTKDTAAVVLEPIQGEGGVTEATAQYLKAARDITEDTGAQLIFDEIQSGTGRTGTFLASGVPADMVLLAKGLAGGLPVGACAVTDVVAAKLPPGGHGSTYGGLPLACAAGVAVLDVLDRENLVARAGQVGRQFAANLQAINHPAIESVTGRGMMVGVRLKIRPAPVLKALQAEGILALAGGDRGLRFLPPYNVAETDLQSTVEALARCLG